jgi:hypothetical protein
MGRKKRRGAKIDAPLTWPEISNTIAPTVVTPITKSLILFFSTRSEFSFMVHP